MLHTFIFSALILLLLLDLSFNAGSDIGLPYSQISQISETQDSNILSDSQLSTNSRIADLNNVSFNERDTAGNFTFTPYSVQTFNCTGKIILYKHGL